MRLFRSATWPSICWAHGSSSLLGLLALASGTVTGPVTQEARLLGCLAVAATSPGYAAAYTYGTPYPYSTPHAVECRPNRQSANLCVSSTPGYHANAPRHHHARRLARRAAPSQGRPLSAIGRPAVEHADVLTQSVPAARLARGRSLLAYRRTSTALPVLFNLLWSEFAVVLIRHI
jgi:hypothetical protein